MTLEEPPECCAQGLEGSCDISVERWNTVLSTHTVKGRLVGFAIRMRIWGNVCYILHQKKFFLFCTCPETDLIQRSLIGLQEEVPRCSILAVAWL